MYGKKAIIVTTRAGNLELDTLYNRVIRLLESEGIETTHFDGVVPNPTTDSIAEGAELARRCGAEVVIGLGGGSSIDAAKAISVEATHPGSCWDYLFFKEPQPQKDKLLPVIAVTTTSGTGSHVTQVAVVTNTGQRDKSALFNSILFPEVAIVDPELMITVPHFITACTGFDVFCHSFESLLNPGRNPYTDMMAWEALRIVTRSLKLLIGKPDDLDLREKMAWADTLAGLCIANSGVTLPHGIGMAIGGMYPHIAHGEALAIVYPAFARYTWRNAIPEFSGLGSLLDSRNSELPEEEAAENSVVAIEKFLEDIGLSVTLSGKGVPENEIGLLAKQSMVLPDYKANPRVPDLDDMIQLVRDCY